MGLGTCSSAGARPKEESVALGQGRRDTGLGRAGGLHSSAWEASPATLGPPVHSCLGGASWTAGPWKGSGGVQSCQITCLPPPLAECLERPWNDLLGAHVFLSWGICNVETERAYGVLEQWEKQQGLGRLPGQKRYWWNLVTCSSASMAGWGEGRSRGGCGNRRSAPGSPGLF